MHGLVIGICVALICLPAAASAKGKEWLSVAQARAAVTQVEDELVDAGELDGYTLGRCVRLSPRRFRCPVTERWEGTVLDGHYSVARRGCTVRVRSPLYKFERRLRLPDCVDG